MDGDLTLFKTSGNEIHGETRDLYWRCIEKFTIDNTVNPAQTVLNFTAFLSSQMAAECDFAKAVKHAELRINADPAFLEDLEKYTTPIISFIDGLPEDSDSFLLGASAYPVDSSGNPT